MSSCARCGAAFECGMVDECAEGAAGAPCWCTLLPVLPPSAYSAANEDPASSRCFCPGCLRTLLAEAGQSGLEER
jgi:hypothetical protein